MCYLLLHQREWGEKEEEEEGMMNDFWTALGDIPREVTPVLSILLLSPIIRLDKIETYAEILVTVGVTALLRPSLLTICWSPCEPPSKLSTGTEASISIGTSFPRKDFTFSPCHLHITFNQNPQEGGNKKQKRAVTVQG